MKERPILFSAEMVRAILDVRKTQTRRVIKPIPEGACITMEDFREKPEHYASCGWCPQGEVGTKLWVRETFIDAGCRAATKGGKSEYTNFIKYVADGEERDISATEEEWDERLHKHVERQIALCPPEPTDSDAPDYWYRYNSHIGWLENEFVRHRPSIFMPRWASRITLEITNIRCERLQEISEKDALAEGIVRNEFPMQCMTQIPDGSTFYEPDIIAFNNPADGAWYPKSEPTAAKAFRRLWDSINEKKHPWNANPWVWAIEFRRIK
jgi:hypothetical protein